MNNNTLYCKILWNNTKKSFKEFCTKHNWDYKDILKHSWAYLYTGTFNNKGEFHINECKDIPKGFYWYGSAENKSYAKAEGLQEFMDSLDREGNIIQIY
jgi:hypothetical protein